MHLIIIEQIIKFFLNEMPEELYNDFKLCIIKPQTDIINKLIKQN